ncbi:MAG: DUF2283 domain-containing protein [Ignavibacteriae bacterium]|nr:DUF2283 domain-containing protein [Ignavibacteriota bacterium]
MNATELNSTLNEVYTIIPHILNIAEKQMWLDYDNDADVLYVNFKKPQRATDSEMLENGVFLRYKDNDVVGLTKLDASKRGMN